MVTLFVSFYSKQGRRKLLEYWWARPKCNFFFSNKWMGRCPFFIKVKQKVGGQLPNTAQRICDVRHDHE